MDRNLVSNLINIFVINLCQTEISSFMALGNDSTPRVHDLQQSITLLHFLQQQTEIAYHCMTKCLSDFIVLACLSGSDYIALCFNGSGP